ncbi:NAD-dependent epimerase/dehydratase family protein, partial [Bacillus sp. S34]|nr:NAD-dependent epimerase/dehydratase family protein [Bacillus sp. S34]
MIIITGATGYIGGRLVPRLLDAGHTVRIADVSAEIAAATSGDGGVPGS